MQRAIRLVRGRSKRLLDATFCAARRIRTLWPARTMLEVVKVTNHFLRFSLHTNWIAIPQIDTDAAQQRICRQRRLYEGMWSTAGEGNHRWCCAAKQLPNSGRRD